MARRELSFGMTNWQRQWHHEDVFMALLRHLAGESTPALLEPGGVLAGVLPPGWASQRLPCQLASCPSCPSCSGGGQSGLHTLMWRPVKKSCRARPWVALVGENTGQENFSKSLGGRVGDSSTLSVITRGTTWWYKCPSQDCPF